MTIPRSEYPRPEFRRNDWMSLNGEWEFSIGNDSFDRTIIVPYACETELSGINDKSFHKEVWYKKTFNLPSNLNKKTVLLHFGAVDYCANVWVNGIKMLEHEGGHTPFTIDISSVILRKEGNTIIVQVTDDYENMEIPRGKQYWKEKSESIFYSRTTGIWQSVWLEALSDQYVDSCFITPDFDNRSVNFQISLKMSRTAEVRTTISFKGETVTNNKMIVEGGKCEFSLYLDQEVLQVWNFAESLSWTPEVPNLFDVVFCVYEEKNMVDEVWSYFGMRKISIDNGIFMLNNKPYYQKLLLDQGYWPESLMTAPTDEAFVKDIQVVKSMGFNGVRKHQKIEDPRYLYYADKMGLLVWGEFPAAYIYSRNSARKTYKEWSDAIIRDYNHPSLIVWTALNESWGVQEIYSNKEQQAHANALYNMIRSLDSTRLVIENDGWEHTFGDILSIHDYESNGEIIKDRYTTMEKVLLSSPGGRALFADGYNYQNQPVVISEFGGIKYSPKTEEQSSWGYSKASSKEQFLKMFALLIEAIKACSTVQGYCYTQLTDIETEENGLLNYDRSEKIPLQEIREIVE